MEMEVVAVKEAMVVAVAARHLHRRRRVAHPCQVRVKRVAIGGHLLGAAPALGGGLGDALAIELDQLDAERRRLAPADGGGVLGGLVQRAELAVGDQERAAHRARVAASASAAAANAAPSSACSRSRCRVSSVVRHAASACTTSARSSILTLAAARSACVRRSSAASSDWDGARAAASASARVTSAARRCSAASAASRALLRLGQHPPQPLQLGGALRLGRVARGRASRCRRPPPAAPRCARGRPTRASARRARAALRAQPRELAAVGGGGDRALAANRQRHRRRPRRRRVLRRQHRRAVVGQPTTLGGVAAGEATGRGAAFLVEDRRGSCRQRSAPSRWRHRAGARTRGQVAAAARFDRAACGEGRLLVRRLVFEHGGISCERAATQFSVFFWPSASRAHALAVKSALARFHVAT